MSVQVFEHLIHEPLRRVVAPDLGMGVPVMVDSSRIRFPEDMTTAHRSGDAFSMESYASEAVDRVKQYARDEPVSFALWAFGIGFVLGWRLKPW